MSKFSTKSKGTKTVNLAGGEAFTESPELEYVSILLTSFVQDQFYRSEGDTIKRLNSLKVDPLFRAKASIFARNEFGMRSITHIAAGEIAKEVKGQSWTQKYFNKVIHRVDDITEIVAYYLNTYGKPIPNSLKKGLSKAFGKFDEYQIAKYRGEGKQVSLVDVVNLVHPKHTETLEKLVKGELKSRETWESKISASGGDSEKKEQAWRELILERKIGYFALLRNLRNIHQQAPDIMDKALELLVDEKLIRKSLVLPFRYLTALEEIEKLSGTQKIIRAISQALDISTKNVPKFDGETLVVLDTSGSMSGRPAMIGAIFVAVLVKSNDADFMSFSDEAAYQTLNSMDSVPTLANSIKFASGGTNFHSIFETANRKYDRIIILSDMQGWIGYNSPAKEFALYKNKYGANPYVYSFDLQGYGTLQFPERNVFAIAGFSEKILDIMKLLEQDKNALINKIKQIEI